METKRLLLCIAVLSLCKQVTAQWQKLALNTSLPNSFYTSISFVSDSAGFLSGCDNPSSWNTRGLFKTTDAGNSWTSIKFGGGGGNQIYHSFTDKDTGYSVETYGTLQPNELHKTTDAGATWYEPDTSNSLNMGTMNFTGAIHFVNNSLGFISKEDTIFKTTNGGKSWQVVNVNRPLNVFAFPSSQTGYAAGNKAILKTTDGGNNWSISDTTYTIQSLSFPSTNTGYAVGANGTIIKTVDSGTTWLPQASGISNTIALNSIFCLDNNLCYAVGDAGIIVSTTNGGTSWTQQSSGVKARLNSVSCTSQHCYAVGDTAVLLKTSTSITGIDKHSWINETISLFPNPAKTEINLKTNSDFKNASVVICDAMGLEVKRNDDLSGKELRILRGGLAEGMYLVHVYQESKILFVQKVIISN